MRRSSPIRRKVPLSPRSSRPTSRKKRTAAEQRAEDERKYGSEERIAWLKSLPCIACRVVGFSEVAHTRTGGTGRKADARFTVPLCGPRMQDGFFVAGCHRKQHDVGRSEFERDYDLLLDEEAEKTEAAWQRQLSI